MTENSPLMRPELHLVTGPGAAPAEAFFEAVAPIFAGRLQDAAENRGHVTRLSGVDLGAMVLSQAQMRGGVFDFRRDAGLIARSGMDMIFVQIITAGSDLRLIGGEEVRLGPGDVVVADLTRPMQTRAMDCHNISFVLPRQAFGLTEAGIDRLHDRILPAQSLGARMLRAHVGMIWDERQRLEASEVPGLVQATAGLLSGLLSGPGGAARRAPQEASRHLQICQFIEENLSDPALGPEALALRFNLSRAALYRLFEGAEGIAAQIRERRLRRAFRLLTAPGKRPVASVGFACGFQSASSFARAFKARFGLAPGEVQASAIPAPQGEGAALLRGWLERANLSTGG